jgi:hypothetical protein
VKQHQSALSCLSGLVKKEKQKEKQKQKRRTKARKVFFSPLTSLFSRIFSLIAIAILKHTNTCSK